MLGAISRAYILRIPVLSLRSRTRMLEKFLLALDQGTTSSRAVLFDREGRMRHIAQQEFRQLFPQPGWVEHDPYDLWHSQWTVTRQLMREQHLAPSDIAAIGITNQRETTLLWDRKTGEPVTNAVVWQDRRTAGACDLLRQQGKSELIRQKTGLVIAATSTKNAPWYIVPADSKPHRDLFIATLLVQTLESLDLELPKPSFSLDDVALS